MRLRESDKNGDELKRRESPPSKGRKRSGKKQRKGELRKNCSSRKRDRPQRAKENLLKLRNQKRQRELSISESSKKLDRKQEKKPDES